MIYNLQQISFIFFTIILGWILTRFSLKLVIPKIFNAGFVGRDVNKKEKTAVPEMGGIGGFFGFCFTITIVFGIIKLLGTVDEYPILVTICVLGIASFIGLMDDIAILGRKDKAILIALSSLPLVISQYGDSAIDFYFYKLYFIDNYRYLFWIILVPIGITGLSNALNMSGGYNGVETGQMVIISFTLLLISIIEEVQFSIALIFGTIAGTFLALYQWNKFPARVFIGDIGQLGFGAAIGAAIIMGGLTFSGVICILPAFYELYATLKYKFMNVERRFFCRNPLIHSGGILKPPEGAEDFTLFFLILGKYDINEAQLTRYVLGLYSLCGFLAIILSVYFKYLI